MEPVRRTYDGAADPIELRRLQLTHKQAALLVLSDVEQDPATVSARLREAYRQVEDYAALDGVFEHSFAPCRIEETLAGPVVKKMCEAAKRFGVGPMAAVAGAIAEHVGVALPGAAVVVENGGDVYARHNGPLAFSLRCGGRSRFPNGIRFAVDCTGGVGVCTSARHGRSISLGRADAFGVVADTAALADAAATAFANRVKKPEDVEELVREAVSREGVRAAIAVAEELLAAAGDLRLLRRSTR